MLTLRREAVVVVALVALTFVYIRALPTRHFTDDAANRLEFTESRDLFELWHSQHLLAQLPGYVAYLAFDPALRAYQSIQLIDALMSGITVAAVYAAARLLGANRWLALAAGLALACSYGFWHYASDPDIYSPVFLSVALLMLGLIAYFSAQTTARAIWLGLAAALAVLMHQLNVELAGLIGLLLLAGSLRLRGLPRVPTRHLIVYGGLIVVIVPLIYLIGWQSASAYMAQTSGTALSFPNWVVRYFNMASSGQASWGKTLALGTLPDVAYTLLKSWTLPLLRAEITPLEIVLIGGLVLSAAAWVAHSLLSLRGFPASVRAVALICVATLIANTVSAWWWQAGNIKFYLPMQIPLIVLAVLYVVTVRRRLATLAVALSLGALILLHGIDTLPYETQGGVFVVAAEMDAYPGSGTPTARFDDNSQARLLPLISPYSSSLLATDFCADPVTGAVWFVIRAVPEGDCPALAGEVHSADYQADVTRQVWEVFAPESSP